MYVVMFSMPTNKNLGRPKTFLLVGRPHANKNLGVRQRSHGLSIMLKNIRALPGRQSFQEKTIMLVMKGAILLLATPGKKGQAATSDHCSLSC